MTKVQAELEGVAAGAVPVKLAMVPEELALKNVGAPLRLKLAIV